MAKQQAESSNLKRFEAPEHIFGPGKWVMRRRKIKLKVQEEIRNWPEDDVDGFFAFLARLIPQWNLDDCETGEPLPNPEDDPSVFGELDIEEELPWVMGLLNPSPAASTAKSGRR